MSTTAIKSEMCKDCLLQGTPACASCWRNLEEAEAKLKKLEGDKE